MEPLSETSGIALGDAGSPTSYQGDGETQSLGSPPTERIISIDDAIERVGFGKFQRRVL